MRTFYLCIIATLISIPSFSQQSMEVFLAETSHDFGKISEEGGIVTYTFSYYNAGSESVSIERINASCGCTSTEWSTEIVMPGDSGWFIIGYDPDKRPGIIDRTATIHFTNGTENYDATVHITGYVKEKPRSVEDLYPYDLGHVHCSRKMVYYGKIKMGVTAIERLYCYNSSEYAQSFRITEHPLFKNSGEIHLAPGESDTITITFNTKEGLYGVNSGVVNAIINNDTAANKIQLRAEVQEDFSYLTLKQHQKAPIIRTEGIWECGTIEKGDSITLPFYIYNDGLSPLYIRRIDTGGHFIKAEIKKTKIKAGKKGVVYITIKSDKLTAQDYQRKLTIITNDVLQPEYTQIISFKVIDK